MWELRTLSRISFQTNVHTKTFIRDLVNCPFIYSSCETLFYWNDKHHKRYTVKCDQHFVFTTCLCFRGRRTFSIYRIRTNSHANYIDNYTWNTMLKAFISIISMSLNVCIYRIYNINNLYWRRYEFFLIPMVEHVHCILFQVRHIWKNRSPARRPSCSQSWSRYFFLNNGAKKRLLLYTLCWVSFRCETHK